MMNGVIQVGYMSAKTKPHPNLYGCYPPHLTSNAYSYSWSGYLSGGGSCRPIQHLLDRILEVI